MWSTSATIAAWACFTLAAALSWDTPQAAHGQQTLTQVTHAKPIRVTDLFALHRNLTEIESISGNELEVGKWLEASLEAQGYHVEMQEVSKDRYNVLAWPGNKRNAPLLLTSHIDTVPPSIPYHRSQNGTISGRGSVDAKASIAAMIVAANGLLNSGEITPDDFALLFVVGEETFGDGMRAANALGLAPKHVVFGEPTEGKLASGHKGILGVKLRAHGKAAHSGYPWLGLSANEIMVKALAALIELESRLPSSDKFGNTTINIGRVAGGVASNVVAESATSEIAMRIAAGTLEEIQKLVTKAIEAAVRHLKRDDDEVIDIEFIAGYGPVPLDDDVPGFESIVANYGTDVPWLNKTVADQKRYLYGPGSILVAHSDHEALSEDDLKLAVEDYKRLILHSLQL